MHKHTPIVSLRLPSSFGFTPFVFVGVVVDSETCSYADSAVTCSHPTLQDFMMQTADERLAVTQLPCQAQLTSA